MRVLKIVNHALTMSEHDGRYVKDFQPDLNEWGQGNLSTTDVPTEAKQFANSGDAFAFWKQQSKRCPLRDDGKPNRPLTAYTVMIEEMPVKGETP
jgi:hypothetical protein